MKFAIQTSDRNNHEAQAILWYCTMEKLERIVVNNPTDVPKGYVPVGKVNWVEKVIGRVETPDYYPAFLYEWVKRRIWSPLEWPKYSCFIKPADQHKRFTGFVTKGGWKGKKKGPWLASEIVTFENEWRYYVANGQVIHAKWGFGKEECEAPTLDIDWPKDYCGAVDFGSYPDGTIALVEANSPFSCGWYDTVTKGGIYAKWLATGWDHITNNEIHTS